MIDLQLYLLGKLNCMRDVFVGTCTLAYDFVAFNSIPSNCTGIYFPIIKKNTVHIAL